jgi:hypothetical protein
MKDLFPVLSNFKNLTFFNEHIFFFLICLLFCFNLAFAKSSTDCFDKAEQNLIASRPLLAKRTIGKVSSLILKLSNGKDLVLADKLPRCTDDERMGNYTLSELSPDGKWAIVDWNGWEVSSRDLYYLVTGQRFNLTESGNAAWSSDGSIMMIYSEDTCKPKDDDCSEAASGQIYSCSKEACKVVWELGLQSSHLVSKDEVVKGISRALVNKYSINATLVVSKANAKQELSILCGIYKEGIWGCSRDD